MYTCMHSWTLLLSKNKPVETFDVTAAYHRHRIDREIKETKGIIVKLAATRKVSMPQILFWLTRQPQSVLLKEFMI